MNLEALLALIAELYANLRAAHQRVTELEKEIETLRAT
jgi:cell division protein FtsB